MERFEKANYMTHLLTVLTAQKSPEDLSKIFTDLMTPQELDTLAERWAIVKALSEGQTQREISEGLGVSITTVTRGNRQLKYGAGGLAIALETAKRLEDQS